MPLREIKDVCFLEDRVVVVDHVMVAVPYFAVGFMGVYRCEGCGLTVMVDPDRLASRTLPHVPVLLMRECV